MNPFTTTASLAVLRRLSAFIHESRVRYGADSPAYWRRFGRYMVVICALSLSFQGEVTAWLTKFSGYEIIPDAWLQKVTFILGILAAGGKMATFFTVDNTQLTPAQRKALDDLAALQKPDVPKS